MNRKLLVLLLVFSLPRHAAGGEPSVRFDNHRGGFPLSSSGTSALLCASSGDFPGVLRVLRMFQNDIASVSGASPGIMLDSIPSSGEVVVVGTLGRSPLIDRLIREQKIDVRGIRGKWETSLVLSAGNPFPGVRRALVIVGSDRRGTMFGMLGISGRMGVSPWRWWADVPVQRHAEVYILPSPGADGPPAVRYRGIFLNDEFPDLTRWVQATYGDAPVQRIPPVPPGVANYGHEFYERIFELLLRLKANYLWPAMWNNAFNEDDPLNSALADELGIVMGTSHQEPMLRAQKEWDRRYKSTLGSWNYARFPDTLGMFWREGIRRNHRYENLITIGLRGADDTPMAPGGPAANMALLEKIIGVQRGILAEEINPDVTKVPQLWCLYKEVLDFYDAGMRVPGDVTLLWPDDNWGNVRRLPTADERARAGGAGVYYHFDYHGGPRSYQWLNANPIAKIWDQMSLAKQYGADRVWIVNVGHLKGYELPLEYFMNLAWDADRWTNGSIHEFMRLWASRQFGPAHAAEIADILSRYTMYNGRRKPELLGPATYSCVNYGEAESVVADFKSIAARAEKLYGTLPEDRKDAFYELVLFPTKASALVNELYYAAGRNALYAAQGRSTANEMADLTRALFSSDTALMGSFNHSLARGKWNHFMDQPHLGYTGWQDPPANTLGAVNLRELSLPEASSMGVAVEGSEAAWPGPAADPALPVFDPFTTRARSIEVFNKGKASFRFTALSDKPWIKISPSSGEVRGQVRIRVEVLWNKVSAGDAAGSVTITGAGVTIPVRVQASLPPGITPGSLDGFMESEGCVSMEAEHYTGRTAFGPNRWIRIEGYGHTLSAMRATSGAGAPEAVPGRDAPCLEYRMYLTDTGHVDVEGIFAPTLNFMPGRGLSYAVSLGDDPPQVVVLVPKDYNARNGNRDWEKSVEDNARHCHTSHHVAKTGYHTLRIWMVDPGVVLQKIVVDCGGVRPSYLGPPESFRRIAKSR